MPEHALLRLQDITFEGAGSYRELVDPLPLSGQGRVLLCGAEGCLDAETHIPYDVTTGGGRVNSQGGSLKRLFHRFHNVEPPSCKGQYLRGIRNAEFFVSSVNDEGRIFKNQLLDVVKTGTKPCFRIETSLGFVIIATADHKFWVGDRYLATSDLHVGSRVYVHNNLRFIAVKDNIVSITPAGERETYDIKVQGPYNNFVANGFVVHNSGKSMIPEVMTLILYGKGSPRMRKTGLVESTIVNDTTGYQGTLGFLSGYGKSEREVSITQAFKHKRLKSRYIITIDGMREEPETKPEAKKLVKRIAPLSYDEWLGVVYLHQGGIHDLLAGTPTEKRQYLTSVFGLDFYDDLLTAAKEELKRRMKLAEGAANLYQTLVDLEADLQEQEDILDEVPGGIEEVEAGIEKLSKRLQSLAKELGKLQAAETAADRLAELTEEGEALSNLLKVSGRHEITKALNAARSKQSELVQSIAEDEATLKGMKQATKMYKRAVDVERSAKIKLDSAKSELEAFGDVDEYPELEQLEDAQTLVDEALTLLGAAASIDMPSGIEEPNIVWQDLAKEASAHRSVASKLEKLAAKNVNVCPTCNTDVEEAALQSSIKTLRKQAKRDRLQATRGVLAEVARHLDDWQPEVAGLTIGDLGEALDEAVRLVEAFSKAEEKVKRAAEAYKVARSGLGSLPKPKNPQKLTQDVDAANEELTSIGERIDSLSEALDIHKEYEALEKTLDGMDVDGLDEKIVGVSTKVDKMRGRYKKAMVIKTRHDQATATVAALSKQMRNVRIKLDEHADNAVKIKHYELTIIPYFNTLRAAKVQSSVSVLEGVLPVYVNAMSASQYAGAEVKLSISDDLKKVDLMLRAGLHAPWISAIQASGGQRRRFTLAIIAALREVSPRRANLMFFDEPFADLESEGKMLFINRLVPLLMERCNDLDSLFVIAHDREILEASNDTFDNVWEARREVGGSQITTGHKLALVDGR